jgi:predicted nucleic acid-binding Zn ribbon protein
MTRQNRRSTSGAGISKIGDLLPQLIVRYGLHRRRNLEQIEEAWRQAIGEQYAAVTQVAKLARGMLTIKVPHNIYVQELSFRQPELIDTLNTLLQDEKIKKIRFEV